MWAFHQSADQCTDVCLDANHGPTLDFSSEFLKWCMKDLRESSISSHVLAILLKIAHYLVLPDSELWLLLYLTMEVHGFVHKGLERTPANNLSALHLWLQHHPMHYSEFLAKACTLGADIYSTMQSFLL